VFRIIQRVFLIYSAAAALVVLRYGYLAATESSGGRKGRAQLVASLAFCSWLATIAVLWLGYDRTRPAYEFVGKIESVRVLDSYSRHYSAFATIRTLNGGEIQVHYSDSSRFMRPGQDLTVRYRGDSGELISATFYEPDGKQEGELHSTRILSQVGLLLIALFCAWASLRKYRRDPEIAEG
jgi:hypothetical protein